MWVMSVSAQLAARVEGRMWWARAQGVWPQGSVSPTTVLLAAEIGWCCAGEEAPPAQALRWLLSPGVGVLGPRGQDGPAPGSQLLRKQVACLDLSPSGLPLRGGHRAQGLGTAGGF